MFRWDTQRRDAMRRQLGLEQKLVCTHLGSFFEWYEPELLVHLFRQIRERQADAHLLVVTPGQDAVREYLTSRFPADAFTVMSAPHDQVPALLNASDLGFLLLRPSPNIKTSSPAKFSEYLNCGLPVLITSDVGDYSELVRASDAGMVVNESTVIGDDFLSKIAASRLEMASRCVDAGRSLTWQSATAVWQDLLTRVL
jgi:glycosyltransferase involved in cell wall biosynthesis